MVDIKILKKSDEELTCELTKTAPAFVNALRRVLMNEISLIVVDKVSIYGKTKMTYTEEWLAHRIGLCPIKQTLKDIESPSKVADVKFTLEVDGPKVVYAKDIKGIEVAYPEIMVMKLRDGETIKLEGTCKISTGEEHTKAKAAHVYYNFDEKTNKFTLRIVSMGQLTAPEILKAGLDAFKQKIEGAEDLLKQI